MMPWKNVKSNMILFDNSGQPATINLSLRKLNLKKNLSDLPAISTQLWANQKKLIKSSP